MKQLDTTVLECGCRHTNEIGCVQRYGTAWLKNISIEQCALHKAAADILTALKAETWLVWSNEHCAWWGPNRSNYYTNIESAGRYSLEEAMRICHFRSQEPNANPTELIQPSPEWIEARKVAIAKATGEAS